MTQDWLLLFCRGESLKKGFRQLLAEAEAMIETLSLDQAASLLGRDEVVFVDIREKGELRRDGVIPGAIHAPRGMLEFWVDPDSPYHREVFASEKKFVLFCAASWRSALATTTLTEMGMSNVTHFDGGFDAWKYAGLPVKPYPSSKPASN